MFFSTRLSRPRVWVSQERIAPKQPRVPCPDVIALRVANGTEKQMLLSAEAEKFFSESHYNGFPAILARLPALNIAELTEPITGAWRCQAPRSLVSELAAQSAAGL